MILTTRKSGLIFFCTKIEVPKKHVIQKIARFER